MSARKMFCKDVVVLGTVSISPLMCIEILMENRNWSTLLIERQNVVIY
jgi:hypothetical protein